MAGSFRHYAASLRGRVVLTLLALVVALVGVEGWQYASRVNSRRQLLMQSHGRMAAAAADGLSASLARLHQAQVAIARAALFGRMPPEQVSAYLDEVAGDFPDLAALQIISPTGEIRYSSTAIGYNNNVAGEPFFQELTPRAPSGVSAVYAGPSRELDRFRVSTLVAGSTDEVVGIVSMELYTRALGTLLPGHRAGTVDLVLDGNGRVAYSSGSTLNPAAVESSVTLRRVVNERQPRPVELRLPGAGALFGTAVPVPGGHWSVAVLGPESDTLTTVARDSRNSMAMLLALVGMLIAGLLLVLQFSLTPLVRLSAATRSLGSGDLSLRLPPAEIREFEPLVAAFNRMAARLEAAHNQLIGANRDLEERVRERTRELEEEHEKVLRAERLSTLGLLSSAIAHDLRNPLNTVTLGLHWLKIRLAEHPDDRVRGRLEALGRELERSNLIIKTLLAFARTGEPERQPTDLKRLVEEVLAVVEPPARLRVHAELPSEPCSAPVDPAQMFQVLENLVRNAVQAMPEEGEIRVSAWGDARACYIRVADTGPGIPPDKRETVFEPLVTTKSTGTGLGLALCQRIVSAHGGRITLEEHAGPGAWFLIELPLDVPAQREAAVRAA